MTNDKDNEPPEGVTPLVDATRHALENLGDFPFFVRKLPQADYGDDGGDEIRGYVLQGKDHQLVFNENSEPMQFKKHKHAQSFGVVLQGECGIVIEGKEFVYKKGDVYHVPGGIEHYAWQSANYKDVVIFNEPNRVNVRASVAL